jgi:hypothetical protein
VLARNGAGLASAATDYEARKTVDTGKRQSSKPSNNHSQAWSLHRGRLRTPLVRLVPDDGSPLYRIAWPDIGLSAAANLSRCKDAAREWAEHSFLTDHRKMSGARRLKSLDNFSWSALPVRQNGADHA